MSSCKVQHILILRQAAYIGPIYINCCAAINTDYITGVLVTLFNLIQKYQRLGNQLKKGKVFQILAAVGIKENLKESILMRYEVAGGYTRQ